ncbi:hypothetical protein B0T20DRAFT_396163 [Sordaria brevicollis]|uniref:Uncharacterized protein n=1 Tax=Sordaria brevicollis TaxID=83679 RepID=A0AAE0P399_SORBR|nr:hypothetical protein B0T20DRAFT_396163 [Sordaria brevicollis]
MVGRLGTVAAKSRRHVNAPTQLTGMRMSLSLSLSLSPRPLHCTQRCRELIRSSMVADCSVADYNVSVEAAVAGLRLRRGIWGVISSSVASIVTVVTVGPFVMITTIIVTVTSIVTVTPIMMITAITVAATSITVIAVAPLVIITATSITVGPFVMITTIIVTTTSIVTVAPTIIVLVTSVTVVIMASARGPRLLILFDGRQAALSANLIKI